MLKKFLSFTRAAWRRSAFERDMDEEMRFHLDARTADLVKRGVAPAAAARQARIEFGNSAVRQDECRDARGLRLVDDFGQDVRFAFRNFRRHKTLAAIVVATLTFGIGISSGVFTLLSAMALRPPVDSRPDSFIRIFTTSTSDPARPRPFAQATVEEYVALRDGLRTVRALAAYRRFNAVLGGADARSTSVLLVTCNFFEVYGPERAALGRLLQSRDCDAPDPVVVLSDNGWRSRFGADPEVVGRVIWIQGVAATVVGVAPRSGSAVEGAGAWVPYTLRPQLKLGQDPRRMLDGHDRWLSMAGRLAAGATRDQAGAEVSVLATQQDRLHAGQVSKALVTDGAIIHEPGAAALSAIGLVMGALSCLLLIACANVATLLLSHADARQQEIAIRLSLGAGRARLMRMLLTETLTLAGCAGVASLYLAYHVPVILARWLMESVPEFPLAPDWRAFAYLVATVGLAGIALGMAPALASMRVDVLESLKGRRSILGTSVGGSRLHAWLVGTQVALSFVLLVGAALFVVTHYQTVTREVGLETSQVLMPRVSYRAPGATPIPPGPAILKQTLQQLPGVQAIVFTATAPVFGPSSIDVGLADAAPQTVNANEVSPGFFQALDIPIVRGRAIEERDGPCVRGPCKVVVSEALVRRLFSDGEPIGRILETTTGAALEVVGVARDTSVNEHGRADPPLIYVPWSPDGRPYQALLRFTGARETVAPVVAGALRARFPGAIIDVHTLRWPIDSWVDATGRIEALVVALGGTATALAVMGVFGVVSLAVNRRRHELAVRIALGARPPDLYAAVMGAALRPAGAGLVCGIALALLTAATAGKVLARLHLTVSLNDPFTYFCAALLLVTVVLIALLVPARRAASASPLTALKAD